MTPVAALALAFLGGAVVLAACAPRAPIDAPTLLTAAPVAVVIEAPTAVPIAAPAPIAPPPTGPGTIACGATRCRAGAEICCLGETPRCVPAPAAPPEGDAQLVIVRQKACGTHHFLACDDAGDCGAGQTCCEETYETETHSLYQGTCVPLCAGRVTCERAELCSLDDPRCARKDNACTDVNGTLRCQLPLALRPRPRCGKKPCPADMTCVVGETGPTCEKGLFRNDLPGRSGVIECDRGRDCGEDESCFQNPQLPGRRCDFTIAGVDSLSEPASCTGPEDCVAYCRLDERVVPNCHVEPKAHGGTCECLQRCAKDADCNGCMGLAVLRGNIDPGSPAFCDRRKKACECRERRP
jgi:hypothetical protein